MKEAGADVVECLELASEVDMQKSLDPFSAICANFGLTINTKKTQILCQLALHHSYKEPFLQQMENFKSVFAYLAAEKSLPFFLFVTEYQEDLSLPFASEGNRTAPPSSKDLESPENSSSQLEDSGCDVLSENRTDPSELSQNVEESFTSSSEISVYQLPIVKSHCALQEKTLSSHLQFLQHVLELKNLTESGSLKTDLNKFESDCSTVSDSVFRLLDGLITFYSDPKLPFSNFLTEAVFILTRLIDDCNLSNHILKKCFKKLEEFEKTLVQVILRTSSINRFQVQRYISNSLVILGKCTFLRKPVISLLLSEVNNFTDNLRNMYQVQAGYDVTWYENIFSLLWVLEQLLQDGTEESTIPSIDLAEQETKKFLEQLDQTILHLSDAFPLFTLYIWRVGVLLNSAQIRTVENSSPP
ncbi:meiosis-specific protein MEI4 [Dromiciops gliroides]|uniref:meiosis-specific protein MEI4 n=1 Tax=Dromiciops gliroides TaxID=33562 RepID=UPI001CC6FB87|nr:meiosis-specific protein MEI4 [Dromiciops gliroides]